MPEFLPEYLGVTESDHNKKSRSEAAFLLI